MAKKPSKTTFKTAFKTAYNKKRAQIHTQKKQRIRLHRSFKRSHREDYARNFEAPGLLQHSADTVKMIFANNHWRTFILLTIIMVILNIGLVGLMSEDMYVEFQDTLDETSQDISVGNLGNVAKAGLLLVSTITTGGLNQGMSEVQQIFAVIIFLLVWLTTIYLVRHFLVGHKLKLRDAFYNACTPLVSTFCVLAVVFLQSIPIIIVIITYSAAISTDFLATPFYALVYFIFAALMILLSGYWLSSSLIALVAVTAPGLYPLTAIRSASDMMAGRRIKFIIRLIFLLISLIIFWVIIMLPIILFDMWLKGCFGWLEGAPIVSVCLLIMTCLSFIYIATYIYLYYRRMLDYEEE